jgi:hypothetical protein
LINSSKSQFENLEFRIKNVGCLGKVSGARFFTSIIDSLKQQKLSSKSAITSVLSKERVRQIELIALQKLRQSLSPKEFEMLTG